MLDTITKIENIDIDDLVFMDTSDYESFTNKCNEHIDILNQIIDLYNDSESYIYKEDLRKIIEKGLE